jgi:hypothetical protein
MSKQAPRHHTNISIIPFSILCYNIRLQVLVTLLIICTKILITITVDNKLLTSYVHMCIYKKSNVKVTREKIKFIQPAIPYLLIYTTHRTHAQLSICIIIQQLFQPHLFLLYKQHVQTNNIYVQTNNITTKNTDTTVRMNA